ncbi:MAG: glycyl-radical enzyme activating protein [Limnochordia bacterium]|nr:glycyl-radical enzyme activating protein [Limnochordia bacterium]
MAKAMLTKAIIFNIQKFSLHDGPGIRTTVFFKGCPLTCLWCHNPESQNARQDMLYDQEKCVMCGMCAKVCPQEAITNVGSSMFTDLDKCDFCGECVIHCIPGAREIAGAAYTVQEVLDQVLKDRVFYEESGGGVTLSGGEPLVQIDFVEELLRRLKDEGIHTALDTCGIGPFAHLERAAKYTDLFLYDLKLTNDEKHRQFTGASNQEIIENLKELTKIHDNVHLRIPIIEGINAEASFIEETIRLIEGLDIKEVHLLPYHSIAKHKYQKLGREYEDAAMQVPAQETMDRLRRSLPGRGMRKKEEDPYEGLH